jgi:hypothetical protein
LLVGCILPVCALLAPCARGASPPSVLTGLRGRGTSHWGLPGDTPVVADFDGDDRSDLAVWRPGDGMWYVRFSSSNYSYADWKWYLWGLPGDVPL